VPGIKRHAGGFLPGPLAFNQTRSSLQDSGAVVTPERKMCALISALPVFREESMPKISERLSCAIGQHARPINRIEKYFRIS
jgi:hypothetical protein